jgi:oxygen-independent coproporphyrinogen-3 oxidase
VQSFNDEHLHRLGRIHGQQEAFRAAEAAHKAGFANFNLDLMFGLPGQTLLQALADIDSAVALNPAHISHYQLTLEPHTPFYQRPPPDLPDEDRLWEMQAHCQWHLAEAGYTQYEISAYARSQQYCRHNLNYWEFGDYLGIGAGAHGKLTDVNGTGGIRRFCKLRNPQAYLNHAGSERVIAGSRSIPPSELGLEFMMNALRLVEGFPAGLFSERTGLPLEYVEPALSLAYARGLLSRNDKRIQPSELGRRFLNDVLELFMPEETERC